MIALNAYIRKKKDLKQKIKGIKIDEEEINFVADNICM